MGRGTSKLILAVITCFLLVAQLMAMSAAVAAQEPSVTPTPEPSVSPAPTPSPTPMPTPGPRSVFSGFPRWETDRISIMVNNSGDAAIEVRAYIGDASNFVMYNIAAGSSLRVLTGPISAPAGTIVQYGFKAYEKGVVIDSRESSLTVPEIPPAESVTVYGTIMDNTTRQPVQGVQVVFISKTWGKEYSVVKTDVFGNFRSSVMYPDNYVVDIQALGYIPVTLQTPKVSSDVTLNTIYIVPVAVPSPTPTLAPTPTPTPGPLDAWLSILYDPKICIGTLSSIVAVLVSFTIIYEWIERRREKRRKEQDRLPRESQHSENVDSASHIHDSLNKKD